MSASNSWAEFAGVFRSTRGAFLEHEEAKSELKGLMPEDAKEAIGHGIRAKRAKSGAISFDLLEGEGASHRRGRICGKNGNLRKRRPLNQANLACRKIRALQSRAMCPFRTASTRASSRYRSRVGFGTRPTSNSCPNNPV